MLENKAAPPCTPSSAQIAQPVNATDDVKRSFSMMQLVGKQISLDAGEQVFWALMNIAFGPPPT